MRQNPIGTAHLRLRTLVAGDLALLQELYCDAETMRHIGRPLSPAQVKASLRATLDAARKPQGPRFFVVVERHSRHAVGLCSIKPDRNSFRAEAGIMLSRSARGRGNAPEAFTALIDATFQQLPIDEIWVQYRKANAAMACLCNVTGFSAQLPPSSGTKVRLCVRMLRRLEWRKRSHQPTRGEAMSNIIGFLENAGSNAALRHASRQQLLRAMHGGNIEPTLRDALLQPQRLAIDGLLGARETMYCQNFPVKPPKKAPPKKKPAKAPPKKAPAKKPAKKAPAKRGGKR